MDFVGRESELNVLRDHMSRPGAAMFVLYGRRRIGKTALIEKLLESIPGAVKGDIDANRRLKGRFIITGSQHFQMMQGVTESLAGRAAVLSLQSFSLRESLSIPGESPTLDSLVAGRSPRDLPVALPALLLPTGNSTLPLGPEE